MASPNDICKCGKIVKEKQQGLGCDLCEKWFHPICLDISKTDYKSISEVQESIKHMIKFTCPDCAKSFETLKLQHKQIEEINKNMLNYQKQVSTLQNQVEELTKKDTENALNQQQAQIVEITNFIQHMREQSEESQTKRQQVNIASEQTQSPSKSEELLNTVQKDIEELKEEKDQEKRAKNAILYNLTERNEEVEIENIYQIIEDIGLPTNNIQHRGNKPRFFRLGNETEGKRRPILIQFVDEQSKFFFLQQWRELKKMNLWCQADLTQKQRDENRKLVDELKQRRDQGESNLIIRKGKIIERSERTI